MSVFYVLSEKPSYHVGRDPSNDLVLTDSYISRLHLGFDRITHDVASLEVFGTNGAVIGGAQVNKGYRCHVRTGDCIRVGKYMIVWIGAKIPDTGGFMKGIACFAETIAEPVEIEGPPLRRVPEKPSVMLAAGPALTMAVPILLGAGRSVAVLSSVFAAVWASLNVISRARKQRAEEKRRRNTYISYLAECESIIKTRLKEIITTFSGRYPDVGTYLKRGGDPFILWNHPTGPDDTLAVRIGRGDIQNPLLIVTPKERFGAVDDSLKELPGMIKNKFALIPSSPILTHLRRKTIAGVILGCEKDRQVLSSFILQAACAYAPDELRIVPDICPGLMDYYSWMALLPHCMHEDGENDADINTLIITDDPAKAYEAMTQEAYIILTARDFDELPAGITEVLNDDSAYTGIVYDTLSPQLCFSYSATLSSLAAYGKKDDSIPGYVPFGMLYDKISCDNILKLYKENDITEAFAAPIGLGAGGKKLVLDLHEKAAGVHGLIAGTTGSGKSELLTTMILSFAVNYPADKLAFFLIDYKGGGMSNLFERLPHLIGSISNLSRGESRRAMAALRSENIRRQEVFAKCGVNNINDYIKLYERGEVKEPLPHVLVIVDEFAELRKEEPEFMDRLISISQVGRSLGIHLILATQKPAGVVDDKIRSNTGFRIALRLALAADSTDLLHRPDAAYLPGRGRALLQVGADEVFECFQSAYSMGEVEDERNLPRLYEDLWLKCEIFADNPKKSDTSLSHTTWYEHTICKIAEADAKLAFPKPARLFLPPLPKTVYDDTAYAIYDNPYRQTYERALYDPNAAGNVWITGRSGSGKSELVYTILMRPAVASAVYVIDCGGGKLAHIRRSPHCGGYVSDDDPDNIGRMTGFVCEELDNRRKNGRSDYPVILALDNYPEIVNISDASVSDHINRILTSGKSVNVYVIATSPLPPGERLARFTDTALYLGGDDVYAASGFLKVSARDIPLTEDIPGRGIGLFDGVPLEFQAVLAKDHTGKSPPSPPDVIHYPYMPKTPTFTEFMERAATESEATEAVRNLPAGYQTKSGKLYSIPLERLKCVLIGGKSYSGRHTLLFNISVTAARYGIECVRADTYEALVSVCRTSAFSGIVTIENISELIDEFYSEIRSDEEEEELASLFDNSTIRSNSQRAHPVLIGIIDDRSAIHSGRKIYRKIFEHPYAIVLGGGLDESRIFDFSYLPFSILKKSHKRGDATILKFDEKLFDGPVTIPVTIDVDNSQT